MRIRFLGLLASAALLVLAGRPPGAAAQERQDLGAVGIAAPTGGPQALLGRQIADGARAAAARLGNGVTARLVEADTECTAEGGRRAAERFVAEKVGAVVGFLCSEAIDAALPILSGAGIPVLDVGVRSNQLTDRREITGHLVWRIAPRSDAEARAVAAEIARRWRNVPFALVEDGSIEARGLTDTVRRLLEEEGLRPSAMENYRPAEEKQFGLARRVARSGIAHLFIAGDRPDVAVIARDAKESGLALEIMGGEKLLDEADPDLPLAENTIAVAQRNRFPELAPPRPERGTDPQADAPEPGPQGYFGPAFAATEIALQALGQARSLNRPLPEILSGATFRTVLGPIRFDPKGDSDLNLFRAFRWKGNRFEEAGNG